MCTSLCCNEAFIAIRKCNLPPVLHFLFCSSPFLPFTYVHIFLLETSHLTWLHYFVLSFLAHKQLSLFSFTLFYHFRLFVLPKLTCFPCNHFSQSIVSSGLPRASSPLSSLQVTSFFLLLLALFLSCSLLFLFFSSLLNSSALRSCSTGDSLLSSAFIRSAKSAPALAPPLPVLLHHHHPFLPPLADHLAGTLSLHFLSACCLETLLVHSEMSSCVDVFLEWWNICCSVSFYLRIWTIKC